MQKRLTCKRARFARRANTTLHGLLADALGRLRKVGQRRERLGADGRPQAAVAEGSDGVDEVSRMIFYDRAVRPMLFGAFASYESGRDQAAVLVDDDAEMLTVSQVAPPERDGKRQQFLDGICFFGIYEDLMVVAQSRALGAAALEQHLNWLFRAAGLFGDDDWVVLADQFTSATKARIRQAHVKEIRIGRPLFEADDASFMETGAPMRLADVPMGLLRQIVGTDRFGRVEPHLKDAIDGNIEVELRIRYRQQTSDKGHRALDELAVQLRNIDADEVSLTLANGARVDGAELKAARGVSVPGRNGMPDPDRLFERMRSWLFEQIQNRMIEP